MQTSNSSTGKSGQDINLVDLFFYLASKWKWYLLSVLVCGGLAYVKYATAPRVYYRSATVIIKDPSNKKSTASLDRYDNLINKSNVANEILQFRSKRIMRETVQRLHADISYRVKDGLHYNELYTQAPVTVSFADVTPARYMAFTVTPSDQKTVVLSDFSWDEDAKPLLVKLGESFKLDGARVTITPTHYYGRRWTGQAIEVRKMPLETMVAFYQGSLGINQEEDESSILKLALKDNSPTRAEDVLNMLITVYNEDAIKDKNQVAVNTADFINERLIIISQELGDVESDLESFKRDNQVIDISSSAGMYMNESQKYGAENLELETQLRLAQYVKSYLTDPKKDMDLIPANTGISDMNIESQINQYNAIKLRRDKLIDDSSEQNPVVEELNNSLHTVKQNIIRAVDNMIVSINLKQNDARNREIRAQSRVASIPKKERQMISIERQQKIKESLYLFLLNRREENALSQAMADNNARVIDSAEGGNAPISPNRNRIMAVGGLMGLAIPSVVFLMALFLDTRIHSRKDITEATSIPYLGEIPIDKKQAKRRKGDNAAAAVDEQGDDIISEAFRILRTNMTFMARKDKAMQVITFTSFNEGAGKTFISRNLAASLALAKKKVVMVDLDIRKGTLSHHLGGHKSGVTNYLADPTLTPDDVIQQGDHFDYIAMGAMAPNPAELLMDNRLDELMDELRKRYEYIIVDNVPVGIIADAAIANRIADLTIFVVKAGKLDRRQLPDLEQLYQEKKLNNMALVLNGASLKRRGYGYGYGYGYGQYKYGYSYGKKRK